MAPDHACVFADGRRAAYRFARPTVEEKCLRHALLHRRLVATAAVTALVVGTVLTAINQGNVLLDGRFPAQLLWKIPLTYTVPYCVSVFSALRISRIS